MESHGARSLGEKEGVKPRIVLCHRTLKTQIRGTIEDGTTKGPSFTVARDEYCTMGRDDAKLALILSTYLPNCTSRQIGDLLERHECAARGLPCVRPTS